MTATDTAPEPFATRVDHALRNAQTALSLSPNGLDAAGVASLNEMLRRFREDVVEVEVARTVTAERPIGIAYTVEEARAHADVVGACSRGKVVLEPSEAQREALFILSLRLRSQIDQHAARTASVPPAADAALSSGDAA